MASPAATPAAVMAAVERVSLELSGLVVLLASGTNPDATAETITAVESAGRLMDAARVYAVAPLARDYPAAEHLGYSSPVAAVATLAQVSERTARTRLAVAEAVTPDLSVSGAPLPPTHAEVATALASGRIGLEAASLITRELDRVTHRVEPEPLAAAEKAMVDLASGIDPSGLPLPGASIDYLTTEIRTIGAAIDPDGALPREHRAMQGRAVHIGTREDDDGLVAFRGRLLPDVANLARGTTEAHRRSPRFADLADDSTGLSDDRTPAQRRHDAFAEALIAAAAADGAPQLNGHPVTVLVTVTAEDLSNPEGLDSDPIGTMAGSQFPVSRTLVERFIDGNGFRQVVVNPAGAILGIGSPERCFTANQTLAIAARDGYRCSTPGCTAQHVALQMHHVVPWREGGPTSTSNGILLCYWHHRRVDDGPWQYRMVNGLPEVRGPGVREWTRTRTERALAA